MSLQTLFALGAMMLLTVVVLNVTETSVTTEDVMYDSNYGILATSIGSSIIEDATRKHFDENSDTVYLSKTDINKLTPINKLGPDGGEVVSDPRTWNDFDDYNNYTRVDSSMPSAVFKIFCRVQYVTSSANLDDSSSSVTWHKKITVKISSDYMIDTLIQTSIFSYWSFR